MSQIPKNYNYNAFTKVLLLRYNHNHGTHIFLSVSCFKLYCLIELNKLVLSILQIYHHEKILLYLLPQVNFD